ncbi:MAG TPA: hypothetical protein VN903_22555 [Polyangia bacterium]|nr:hypothetical protein [Polyangia bacterium]
MRSSRARIIKSWFDAEPSLVVAGRTELRRLGRRAQASWPIWLAAAAALTAAMTIMRARGAVAYSVTAVVRVTENQLVMTRGDLGVAALRTHLRELTFTRQRLQDLIRSHPKEFPRAAKDFDLAIEDLRDRIKVDIIQDDVVEDYAASDPPNSARISLSYSAPAPDAAWKITNALVDLMIDSALARERAALLREQAGAEAALETAQQHLDDASATALEPAARLKAKEAQVAAARLELHAAGEQQLLRFELVDPGRIPPAATHEGLVINTIVTFVFALLAASLLAGAFDPRVVEAADVATLGMSVIGRLPMLPPAPDQRAEGDENKPDTPSPPGD